MLKHIIFHRDILESWRWFELSIYEQLANIWAEVWRSLNNIENWKEKEFTGSINRAYELLDMAMADKKWKNTPKLKEICMIRELISDYFFWYNEYKSDKKFFERYFFEFSVIANEQRRKRREEKRKNANID